MLTDDESHGERARVHKYLQEQFDSRKLELKVVPMKPHISSMKLMLHENSSEMTR